MATVTDIPAWIALFIGVYSLSASIGELRAPGFWASMLEEFEGAPAQRFLTGFLLIALGAAIYLVTPWQPNDWLAVIMTILGAAIVIEGAVILAFGDLFLPLARSLMSKATLGWAIFSTILGLVLIVVALLRLWGS